MSKNKPSENTSISLEQQRETLLSLNYDKLYGVYELLEETDSALEFHLLKNCLVAFENQIPNLQWLWQVPDMTIIDLKSLSEWNIKVLHWPVIEKQSKKIVMCSGWMIDFFVWTSKTGEKHIHMLTSLRDANAGVSLNQRTTVAGRCLWENVRKDIEIETAEEAPFLWKINGEFYLAVWNDNFDYVKGSILSYLENKYDTNNSELKKMFERWLRGMKYEDLWEILRQIVENNRLVQYNYKELNDVSALQHLRKKVKIWNYEENFYVVYNDKLNTYELKLIKQFESFPEGFELVGKRPNRLFLESSNQYPRLNRIQNATKINPSWAIKIFTEHISRAAWEILKEFNNWSFVFSEWKTPDKNEDAFYQSENVLILSDGATDKSGKLYNGKTGWEIISKIIVSEAQQVWFNWGELVEYVNKKIWEFYSENNVDIWNGLNIFSWTLVIARIQGDTIVVTQVWDSSFRINGKDCYTNEKLIDKVTSILRQKFILKFWEDFAAQAREFILPVLKIQNLYQNSAQEVIFNEELLEFFYDKIRQNIAKEFEIDDILEEVKNDLSIYFWQDISYWVIDGINTPNRFIKEFVFDKEKTTSIEIFSDWYLDIPEEVDINAWEDLQEKVQKEDPFKYKKYPSTKSNDDRTIIIKTI